MWKTNFIEAISERDVDLLFLEELTVNCCFRDWFLQKAGLDLSSARFLGAFHSICDARLGESDLILGFEDGDARSVLLLENKIDALFQPDQAERYHHRGHEGVRQGTWSHFTTCLVAPSAFLKNQSGAGEFDSSISYEDIIEWFTSDADGAERSRYRAQVLRFAAEKTRRKSIGKAVPEVTQFWAQYWELCSAEFPELQMPRPDGKGPGADWPDFRGLGLPRGTHILHKWADGKVDLELSGQAPNEDVVRQNLAPHLPEDMTIEVTGKSLAIRIMVPPLDRWAEFAPQVGAARGGLLAVKRLAEVGPALLEKSNALAEAI